MQDYSDIVFLVNNEEVPAIKSDICMYNEELKRRINEKQGETKILLPAEVTKKAFILLNYYYGNVDIDINEDNVSELLLCCICLNDDSLMIDCKNYILSHLNNKLAVEILNMMEFIPESLDNMKSVVDEYIKINWVSICDDENMLKYLRLSNFEYAYSLKDLLIPSNEYLLAKQLKHYHERIEDMENKRKKYNDVLKLLNWNEIDLQNIDAKDLEIIETNEMLLSRSQTQIKRKYGRIPHTGNRVLNKMILNGFRDRDSIKDMFCIYLYYD